MNIFFITYVGFETEWDAFSTGSQSHMRRKLEAQTFTVNFRDKGSILMSSDI
jgi:hypothetical protein